MYTDNMCLIETQHIFYFKTLMLLLDGVPKLKHVNRFHVSHNTSYTVISDKHAQ